MSNIKASSKPKLSIVLASHDARASVADCLRAIENQSRGVEYEIIVVDNSNDGTEEIIPREFSSIKLVYAPRDRFIPQLWGIGINESCGDIIVLTTTHFIPANKWIAEILKIHEESHAGVGGAIENDEGGGVISWAVYFCRYSRYMLPFVQQYVDDFAADNASYKRRDLEFVKPAMADGFWEVFIHQAMQRENMSLLLNPKIVVSYKNSFTFYGFMRQRFSHGKQFGKTRAGYISVTKRMALILLSPLIPFVYLYRISKRIFGKKRNVRKFLVSLPILFLFLTSWSLGELLGYLQKSE
jgi:glycosyltransferase involved in cell wall biosynthesis